MKISCKNIVNLLIFISSVYSGVLNVPGEYPTIQGAIDASVDGDTVSVSGGVYTEELTIEKSITLVGQSATIDASGFTNGILIGSDNVEDEYTSNVEINGFEIIGDLNTMCGIQILPGSQNIMIKNNNIHGMRLPNSTSSALASYGILSWGIDNSFRPSNITVANNEIWDVRAIGISFGSYSNNVIVEDNNIHDIIEVDLSNSGFPGLNLSVGVNAQYSSGITISDNSFTNIMVAISQTWVGEVVIGTNTYNNINLFYGVDQYSYEANNNIELDSSSFGNYVQSSFTVLSSNITVESIGWFSTINDAIESADENTEVIVSKGTFNENIIWPNKNIELIGAGIDSTIINGDGSDRVVKFEFESIDEESLLKGFTIQNGNGGILIDGSSPVIDSCKITNNISSNDYGGGIKINGLENELEVSPWIKNNLIMNNQSIGSDDNVGKGGGIYIAYGATPVISKNLIAFNTATGGKAKGGGIYTFYSSPNIENNTIYENMLQFDFSDCPVDPSSGSFPPGCDSLKLGRGLFCDGNSIPIIEKTIIWGSLDGVYWKDFGALPNVSYCDIKSYPDVIGTSITSNPLFCDEGNLDFTLADNSPCSLGTLEFIGAYNTGDCGDIILDCVGVPSGTAYLDECDDCVGGTTNCTAGQNLSGVAGPCEPCIQDCLGEWGGTHYVNSDGDCCNYEGTECLDIMDSFLPDKLEITSISPNPFNPTTTIEYSVPEFLIITINIYDLSGSLIKTLVKEAHPPGNYTVSLEMDNVPTGTYLINLVSNKGSINRKITVIK